MFRSALGRFSKEALIAVLGITMGQAILYGPSLIGSRILLPLRLLAVPGSYLPTTDEYKDVVPDNVPAADLVFYIEPERQFAHRELRAGRLPLWTPYRFAGAPLYMLGFSPPWLLAYAVSSPVILAWTQMFVALIAGLGMFYFCRRVLQLGFWPSTIAAWCYPITGAYVLWVGQWLPAVMCWLPWLLAAVDRTVRSPSGWGGRALCVITFLASIGGSLDVAGQLLLTSGLYAVWCIFDEYGRQAFSWSGVRASLALTLGWALGIACAMWILLPLSAYVRNGSRMINRSGGAEERPPVGLAALPQIVLPDMYGAARNGSVRISRLILQESSAAAYVGSAACLVLAPLAWFSRKRRSVAAMLTFLSLFALSWSLNIPGLVHLLRLPVLNMMSHNRLVFVSGFALLVLAVIGLDALLNMEVRRRRWFVIPAATLLALSAWCIFRSVNLPEPVATQLASRLASAADIDTVQQNFRRAYAFNALFCFLAVALWGALLWRSRVPRWLAPATVTLLFVQLFHFGGNHASQTDPRLYFPKIPVLERLAETPNARVIGFNSFPANLAQLTGLADVRGYDGIDPRRIVQLLLTTQTTSDSQVPYARTQFLSPFFFDDPQTQALRIPPILDMLNVRYVIFRGTPPEDVKPYYADEDYWVFSNENALPRAFVPAHVEFMPDESTRLVALSRADFDARKVAYVEEPLRVPYEISGNVTVLEETPREVRLEATMKTAGLVVLSYRWDQAWRVFVNDEPATMLRANHALRAVRVDAGTSTIRFVYSPQYLHWGLVISGIGAAGWLIWIGSWALGTLRMPKSSVEPVKAAAQVNT